MDEAGGCIGIVIAIGVAIYAVVVFVGYALAYLAFALFSIFGHPISLVLGLIAVGAIGGGIYHSRRGGSGLADDVSVVRIGPIESSPRKWFFVSSAALIGALVVYRMVAF